jgi:CRISPR-associated protein Cas5t
MYGFYISLQGMTASFREPGTQLYQVSLPLPPISTMVGLAGAALGLGFKDVWDFFKKNDAAVGVKGETGGRGIDLWRYKKVASPKTEDEKALIKELGWVKATRADILNREFLASPKYEVCYAAPRREIVEDLRRAFENPRYALSLGSSDDIVTLRQMSGIHELTENTNTVSLKNTLIEGDFVDQVTFDWEAIKKNGVARTLRVPVTKQLVVDFKFDGETRQGIRYRLFTFLIGEQRLHKPVRVFALKDQIFPLYIISEGLKT